MLKVYVVNLDKDVQKLASIDAQLKLLGVPYTRISAVYGKDMSDINRRKSYNAFRWWCAVGRPIAPAEIGCALSHYGLYQKMQADEVICILEDDVIVSPDFKKRLDDVERFIDIKRPQVVMLSSHEKQRFGVGVVRDTTAMCTDGYVITGLAAHAVLKENLPMSVPCDHWWRWERKGLLELYHALPSVVKQDQVTFIGTTQYGMQMVRDYPLPKWVWHKMMRVVGKLLDRVIS